MNLEPTAPNFDNATLNWQPSTITASAAMGAGDVQSFFNWTFTGGLSRSLQIRNIICVGSNNQASGLWIPEPVLLSITAPGGGGPLTYQIPVSGPPVFGGLAHFFAVGASLLPITYTLAPGLAFQWTTTVKLLAAAALGDTAQVWMNFEFRSLDY